MSVAQLQAECRLWDVNEVVFRPDVWPTFEPLLRADFSLFDQYTFAPEGKWQREDGEGSHDVCWFRGQK